MTKKERRIEYTFQQKKPWWISITAFLLKGLSLVLSNLLHSIESKAVLRLPTADCRLPTADCRLWTADCGLWTDYCRFDPM